MIGLEHYLEVLRRQSKSEARRDPARLLLAFKKRIDREDVEKLLGSSGLVLEDADDGHSAAGPYAVGHSPSYYWIRTPEPETAFIDATILGKLQKALDSTERWIGPVYRSVDQEDSAGLFCPVPDVLFIKPASQVDNAALDQSLSQSPFHLQHVASKSKYLSHYRYYRLAASHAATVYDLPQRLLQEESTIKEVHFLELPLVSSQALVPGDTHYGLQWNLPRILAEQAWDVAMVSPPAAPIRIAIIDTGCDLAHPDLQFHNGYSTGEVLAAQPGRIGGAGVASDDHGTKCAGVAGAHFHRGVGVAGLAIYCEIIPLACECSCDWTEIVECIKEAADRGARIISMSISSNLWATNPAKLELDSAIDNAQARCVICVATHDDNKDTIRYPARNPQVLACGASDVNDRRWQSGPLGSNWGPEMSVVAPGAGIPTTAHRGQGNLGTPKDYTTSFGATSASTPHVAGLAALLLGRYPALNNREVRNIIERTADRVHAVGDASTLQLYNYTESAGHPNGRWNKNMGYGRINAYHAMDLADVMIKDWPNDDGSEPSSPPTGNFWDQSDIIVRPNDDGEANFNAFLLDPQQSSRLQRGQTNFLYVRVTNNGPARARQVFALATLAMNIGPDFVFPGDWTSVPLLFEIPTPIAAGPFTIDAGAQAVARFSIADEQVENLLNAAGLDWWTGWG
ncbi:MAG TPA: S8 family serine peptidase, partial [Nitrospiraceae bacterium]